jgi:hypothetical protein
VNCVRRQILVVASALALGFVAASCGVETVPRNDWPDGTLVIARREALAQLLGQLQALPGSKLSHRAGVIAATLPDCAWLEARSLDGAADLENRLDCYPRNQELAGLERERGEADVVFALPAHAGERVVGTLSVTASGDVEARLRVPRSAFSDARTLLRPSAAEPGPNLLSHADELVHARLRPEGGLDIASLIPAQGQADHMFRLKSEIFAGAVLDGTWEIAIYLPEPDRPMPRAALAVGFSLRAPAVAAMEQFLSDLQESWPVRRSPFALGSAEGACLPDLNLLPDLAPCYLATESALVVGWNSASLRRALEFDEPAHDSPHPAAGLHVDLARFPEADARFAKAASPDEPDPVATPLPWQRMSADGVPRADGVHVHIHFDRGDGA